MDDTVTQADQWHRSQLSRQLQRLIRAVAVLGYCRHSGAIKALAESITEVEQTLSTLSASPSAISEYLYQLETSTQSESQRLLIEAHTLLTQARSLINVRAKQRFKDPNIVEMRHSQADLADAAFERMLAASDVPSLYSSTAASESLFFGSNYSIKSSTRKNKRVATSLKLVVDNSDSQPPASPGH